MAEDNPIESFLKNLASAAAATVLGPITQFAKIAPRQNPPEEQVQAEGKRSAAADIALTTGRVALQASEGLGYAYNQMVSRPLSTAFLASNPDYIRDIGAVRNPWEVFDTTTWRRAWQDASKVSPGQSLVGAVGGFVDGSQGTDKIDWSDKKQVDEYFDRGPQKYISFGSDVAFNIFLDPYYVGGKGLGIARRTYLSRPVTNDRAVSLVNDLDKAVAGEDNGARALMDGIKANADNPDVLSVMDIVAKSRDSMAMTDVLGRVAREAVATGDDRKLADVIKVGIGDIATRERLAAENSSLLQELDGLAGRKLGIDKYLADPKNVVGVPMGTNLLMSRRVAEQVQEAVTDKIKSANQSTDLLERIINNSDRSIFGSIQTQTFSKSASVEARKVRESIKFSEAYWGISDDGNGTRVLRWFNPSMPLRERPSGLARITGTTADRSHLEARARVRQIGKLAGLSGDQQRNMFQTYFQTTNKANRGRWFEKLEERGVTLIIKKHMADTNLNDEELKLVEEVAKSFARRSAEARNVAFERAIDNNYTIDDGYGNEITLQFLKEYVDEIAAEIASRLGKEKPDQNDFSLAKREAKNLLKNVPTTSSQVDTVHIGMNLDLLSQVIRENTSVIKAIVDDYRLNPEDYSGSLGKVVDDILKNKISDFTAYEKLTTRTAEQLAYAKDSLTANLDTLYSLVWKPITLMSFKYTSRNLTEGWQRVFSVMGEYHRDSGISRASILRGMGERGFFERSVDNKRRTAAAKAANKVINQERTDFLKEQKKLSMQIREGLYGSSDSIFSHMVDIVRYSTLVNSRYGKASTLDQPVMTDLRRYFASAAYRFADTRGMKNDVSRELYDSIASGDIEHANNILISTDESTILDTAAFMQGRIRDELDILDGIIKSEGFDLLPFRAKSYVMGSVDSFKSMDDSLQNLVTTAVTRAAAQGRMNRLIAERSMAMPKRVAGESDFELVPGLMMNGSRADVIGQIMQKEASAASSTMRVIFDSSRINDGSYMTGKTKADVITPDKVYWAEAAADFANHHMNDVVAQRMIADEPVEDIIKWAKGTSSEAKSWRELKKYNLRQYKSVGIQDPIRRMVEEIWFIVNNTLPNVGIDGSVIRPLLDDTGKPILSETGDLIPGLRRKAMEGKLTAEDMLSIPESQRASVFGDTPVESDSGRFAGFWTRQVGRIFKVIGTLPEDTLVRHPFYKTMYQSEARRVAKLLLSQGKTTQQIEDMLPEIQSNAHKFAYKMLMERMYSIERYTDPAATMRFLSPFYMAKQNSNRYWFGYALRNPQGAARYFMLFQTPGKVFSVEDENGREVKTVNPFDAQDATIKVKVPKDVAKFFGADIPEDSYLNTPISSFDLINNGYSPFIPEPGGPMVDVFAGTVFNTLSGTKYDPERMLVNLGVDPEFLRKKLFPFYKSQQGVSTGDVLLSMAIQPNSWMRSLAASQVPLVSDLFGAVDSTDTQRYNSRVIKAYQNIFAEWDAQRDPNNPEPLTPELRTQMLQEAMGAAAQMNIAEAIFSGFGWVAAPKFSTNMEELRKDLRLYQSNAVAEGRTQDDGLYDFIKEHGFEKAAVAQFTPREANPYGFMSTPQTVNNIRKYGSELQNAYKVVGSTKVAGAMLNEGDAEKDYSDVANSKLYDSDVSAIGAVKNKLTNPDEASLELEINQGFKLQFAAKDKLDSDVEAGLISQEEADFRYKEYKKYLASRYPAYKADSGTVDLEKSNNNVITILAFLRSEKYVNDVVKRNDLQKAVYYYMQARKQLIQQRNSIDSNPKAELDSSKFSGVRANRDNVVRQLSEQVPEFASFFKYYLENDNFSVDGEIAGLR